MTSTQPFPALFRGQPIIFLLAFTTGSSLSPFAITIPLATACALELIENNNKQNGLTNQTTNTPSVLWQRKQNLKRKGQKKVKLLKLCYSCVCFHGSKLNETINCGKTKKIYNKWGQRRVKCDLFFSSNFLTESQPYP